MLKMCLEFWYLITRIHRDNKTRIPTAKTLQFNNGVNSIPFEPHTEALSYNQMLNKCLNKFLRRPLGVRKNEYRYASQVQQVIIVELLFVLILYYRSFLTSIFDGQYGHSLKGWYT